VPAGGGWVGGAPGGSNTTLILGAGALGLAALVLLTRRK
jgi:threonine dehydrogenase-like Zn-dependent dehydrogenase